jgi:beta-phosphoglucomutase
VLVDSYQAHFESWQRMCVERGLSMTRAQFVATFGRTSREVIRDLWGDMVAATDVATIDDRKEAYFREILAQDFPVMDGAVALLDQLRAAGFSLAIGSSAPPENVELSLDGLGRRDAFGAVITAVDVTRGKPDPQVFLLAAERLCVPPALCVVVEDAPAGLAAAHAAGMKCVAMLSTGRLREPMQTADLLVTSLRELSPVTLRQLIVDPRGR